MNPRSNVTLSTENGRSRFQPSRQSRPASSVAQRLAQASRRPFLLPTGPRLVPLAEWRP
jgi:hypothetical protein